MDDNSQNNIIIEEVLIEKEKDENNIFEKLCNLQKLIKKESALIKLCKINKYIIQNKISSSKFNSKKEGHKKINK